MHLAAFILWLIVVASSKFCSGVISAAPLWAFFHPPQSGLGACNCQKPVFMYQYLVTPMKEVLEELRSQLEDDNATKIKQ